MWAVACRLGKWKRTPENSVSPVSSFWPIFPYHLPAFEPHSPPEIHDLLSILFAVWLLFCSVASLASFSSSLQLSNLLRKKTCPGKPFMGWVRSRFIITFLSAEEQRQETEMPLCWGDTKNPWWSQELKKTGVPCIGAEPAHGSSSFSILRYVPRGWFHSALPLEERHCER